MFNKNFYPTPMPVIEQMLHGLNIKSTSYVLEPSAGKGDIAAHLKYRCIIDCIEIDEELRGFLQSKGLRIVANDFLAYKPARIYDFIIMNPPFDDGAAHLLHAWEIADGTTIVCLLNAETVQNPYTYERQKLAEIIEKHGTVTHLGKPFASGAERATNVETVMVRLVKPEREGGLFFDLKRLKEEETGAPYTGTEIATKDSVFNRVACLRKAQDALREASRQRRIFEYYAKAAGAIWLDSNILEWMFKYASESAHEYNKVIAKLHKHAWDGLMEESSLKKYIVGSIKNDFEKQRKLQHEVEFSEENIMSYLELIMGTRGQIMERVIGEVFDKICSYDERRNKLHFNGWKTNSAYKVNRKIIVPVGSEWYQTREDMVVDLDKALCFITGDDFNNIETVADLKRKYRQDLYSLYNNKHESRHFVDIKFYKKGTIHLTFRDDYTWAQFNQIAAKGKNWIGSDK